MNRSKGQLPPQGDHPDQWPELSDQGQTAQPVQPAQQGVPAQPGQVPLQQQGQVPGQAPQGYHLPNGGVAPGGQTDHHQTGHQMPAPAEQTQPAQYAQPVPQPAPQAAPQPEYTAPPQHTAPPAYAAPTEPTGALEYTHPPQYAAPGQPAVQPEFTQVPQTQPPHSQPPHSQPPQGQAGVPGQAPVAPNQAATGYAPQFDRYAPPPAMSPAPAPQQGLSQLSPVAPAAHDAPAQYPGEYPGNFQAQEPGYDQRGTIHDHAPQDPHASQDQWNHAPGQPTPEVQHHATGLPHDGSAEFGGPELGHYMPAAAAGAVAYVDEPQLAPAGYQAEAQQQWGAQGLQAGEQLQDPAQYSIEQAGFEGDEGSYEDDAQGYEDEPRSGGRGLLIASALVGAIALGGGLAFAYKHFGGTTKMASKPKVVMADRRPVKMQPKNPGGRVFRNQGRKVFGQRLNGTTASNVAASGTTQPSGVRRVATQVIRPNRPAPARAVRPVAPTQRLSVPGITVPGLTLSAPRVPQRVTPNRVAAVTPIVRRVAPVLPKARPLPTARAPAAAVKKTLRQRLIEQPRAAPRKVVRAQPVRSAPVAVPAGAASGYVALISSSKSKIRTLAAFANMQQRFPTILAGKQPEIRKYGSWYQLRIGPPSSKQATNSMCQALLAKKGAKECIVRRY